MESRQLGNTDMQVSSLCLGTMTWGRQNTEAEGFAQMDLALDHGIHFFDTAEMYAVPSTEEFAGTTETIVGNWLKKTGNRERIILASKVTGPGMKHIRGGSRFNREHILHAIDGSLKRLQTDYLALYQLHWPDRNTNYFGKLGYRHKDKEIATPISETLEVLGELLKTGKIRHYGLSNETPWGVMSFIREAEKLGLPAPVSIQNPYSLVNRTYEVGLAEISHRENIGLLAYSPLGMGVLSGKYRNNQWPENARLSLFRYFARYSSERTQEAVEHYYQLAQQHGLSLTQMALQFVTQQSFVTSNILGATSVAQLQENIASAELTLSEELLKAIEEIHNRMPNPAP